MLDSGHDFTNFFNFIFFLQFLSFQLYELCNFTILPDNFVTFSGIWENGPAQIPTNEQTNMNWTNHEEYCLYSRQRFVDEDLWTKIFGQRSDDLTSDGSDDGGWKTPHWLGSTIFTHLIADRWQPLRRRARSRLEVVRVPLLLVDTQFLISCLIYIIFWKWHLFTICMSWSRFALITDIEWVKRLKRTYHASTFLFWQQTFQVWFQTLWYKGCVLWTPGS